jgi:fatty acid amide hydrolase
LKSNKKSFTHHGSIGFDRICVSMVAKKKTDNKELHALTASEISAALIDGSLRSTEIVQALRDRRRIVDSSLNSFVANCNDDMKAAEEADAARKAGKSLGPLHGLPMTIKDSVNLRGFDSTMGIASRVGHPASEDSVLVAELRRQGVIFLGKTNVPQALLAQETDNPIFGVTKNPWDLERTPGGSSGGESAAIAAGLSPLGIGTDIGGSIRIPAHFCGIVGFKPTLDRWSNRGSNTAIAGQELVRAQIGCLARSVSDVQLLWDTLDLRRMAESDPLMSPLSSGTLPNLSGLTIGFVDDDNFLTPCRSIRRALAIARGALEEAGAKVVSHWPIGSRDVLATWLSALTSDDGQTLRKVIGPDAVSQAIKPSMYLLKIPRALRRRLSGLLSTLGERRLGMLLEIVGEKSVTQLWELTQRRTELRIEEFDAWRRSGIDALICPPHVVPAMGLGTSGDYVLSLGAMFRWTLLGFPAAIVPVTKVQADETSGYEGGSDRIAKKTASILEGSAGLPVGVQVVDKPFAEEAMLATMAAIESHVQSLSGFPHTPIDPKGV